MRTRITHIWMTPGVVAGDKKIPFIQDAEILIDGNRIVYAGKRDEAPTFEAEQVIEGKGALAMPGLCNLHTHTPMTLFRSIGADLPLDRWLQEAIWPLEKFLTDDAVRAGTDLGTLEMLRYGTTSFNDMYFRMDRMAESVQESGMRAMLGHGVVDFDESCSDLLPGIAFAEKWNGAANDRIHVNLAPHSEGATTRKVMERTVEEARRLNVAIHIHVSETKEDRDGSVQRRGKTPPQYLDELGMLDGPLLAAHCVWMDDEDIRLFAEKGTYIVHNPISNLKLASGVAPIAKMLAAGCKVALGTDGVASNNNLNLWEEIKLMPMLQKGTTLDPTVVSPAQVLAAATSTGAEALGYYDLGLLKPGYLADIILVDTTGCNCCPWNDPESDLIYSINGGDVTMTMVDGRVLYQEGRYFTLDPKAVMECARKENELIFEKARKSAKA